MQYCQCKRGRVVKYNTYGTQLWQRTLNGTSAEFAVGVATDKHDNVYIVGQTNSQGTGGYDAFIVKYDYQGIIQWQNAIGTSGNEYGKGIAADSLDGVYVLMSSTTDISVIKFGEDGETRWQRSVTGPTISNVGGIHVDDTGAVYVASTISGIGSGTSAITTKLPADGSKIGTYGSYVYKAATWTVKSTTLTDTMSALPTTAVVVSVVDAGLTQVSGTPTSTLIVVN